MELGMIGLGRMGANIVRRLLRGGHRSRGEGEFADKLLSALRFQFGGHVEQAGR